MAAVQDTHLNFHLRVKRVHFGVMQTTRGLSCGTSRRKHYVDAARAARNRLGATPRPRAAREARTPLMTCGAVRRLVARAHVTSGAFRCHTASQETPPHTRVARGACAAPHHPSSARARARVSTRSFSRCAVAEGGPSGGAKRRRRPARSRGAPRPPSARARASTRRSRDERAKRLEGIASKIGGFVRTRAAHERLAGRRARHLGARSRPRAPFPHYTLPAGTILFLRDVSDENTLPVTSRSEKYSSSGNISFRA